MRTIRLKQSIGQTYRSLFELPFQVRYGNSSAKPSSGSSSSDLLTTQATTTETEALPENPNSSETKENLTAEGVIKYECCMNSVLVIFLRLFKSALPCRIYGSSFE